MSLTGAVEVPPRDREVLAAWLRSPSIRAGLAQRARIVLLAAEGASSADVGRRVGVSLPTVHSWRVRYATGGLAGLEDRPRSGRPAVHDEQAIIAATLEAPRCAWASPTGHRGCWQPSSGCPT